MTRALALTALLCSCAAVDNRLRLDAGAHTGCPPERVEIVDRRGELARVLVCDAPHLCRWSTSYSGDDLVVMAAAGSWRCEPVDGSTWHDGGGS